MTRNGRGGGGIKSGCGAGKRRAIKEKQKERKDVFKNFQINFVKKKEISNKKGRVQVENGVSNNLKQ